MTSPLSYLYSRVISVTDDSNKKRKNQFQSPIVSLQSGHKLLHHSRTQRLQKCFNPLSYLYSRVIGVIAGDDEDCSVFQSPIVSLQSGHLIIGFVLKVTLKIGFNPLSYLYSRVIYGNSNFSSFLGLLFQSPIVSLQSGH